MLEASLLICAPLGCRGQLGTSGVMIPARPSPDLPDPNVVRKNRKFLLLAVLVGLVFAAGLGVVLWVLNR